MTTGDRPHPKGAETLRTRKDFWDRWSTRAAVVVFLISAVVAVALATDPENEPWYAKTLEVVHDLVTQAHPGGVA